MDKYFTNIEQALQEASKQNIVIDRNQNKRLQYCYYNGPLTDITLENFIQVSQADFVTFFSNNDLPIPKLVISENNDTINLELESPDIIEAIIRNRDNFTITDYIHQDSYFIEPLYAMNVAKQRNKSFFGHRSKYGIQLCYYNGAPLDTPFDNLINLNLSNLIGFFSNSYLRVPSQLVLPNTIEEDLKIQISTNFEKGIEAITNVRHKLIKKLTNTAQKIKPDYSTSKLRIFFPYSDLSAHIQIIVSNIADELEKQGNEILFEHQLNSMEEPNKVALINQYISFKPHVVFSFNKLCNDFLHHDVININWWIDYESCINLSKLLAARRNDFTFSTFPDIDFQLYQRGIKKIFRQTIPLNNETFNDSRNNGREEKIVFIGNNNVAEKTIRNNTKYKSVIDLLVKQLNKNPKLTKKAFIDIAQSSSLGHDFIVSQLLQPVVTYYTVKQLCQNDNFKIEIYGYGWKEEPFAEKHIQGELLNDKEAVEAYSTAKYGLIIPLPSEFDHKKSTEMSISGCIPLVYDYQFNKKLQLENNCIYFNKIKDLVKKLSGLNIAKIKPLMCNEKFNHNNFVKNLLELYKVQKHTKNKLIKRPIKGKACKGNIKLKSDNKENIKLFKKNIKKNLSTLKDTHFIIYKKVKHFISSQSLSISITGNWYGFYETIELKVKKQLIYTLSHKQLASNIKDIQEQEENNTYAFSSMGSGYEILEVFEQSKQTNPSFPIEIPLYIIEPKVEFIILNLILHDFSDILRSKRVFLFFDNAISKYYEQLLIKECQCPSAILFTNNADTHIKKITKEKTQKAINVRLQEFKKIEQENKQYYSKISRTEWYDKLKKNNIANLKILGITSKFTSFLQYCTRDVLSGFEKLGAKTICLKESENFYRVPEDLLAKTIHQFKPDIIFVIDHFSFEYPCVPNELPFITWVQDLLPIIKKPTQAPTLNNFIFSFREKWIDNFFSKIKEYEQHKITFLPIGFNEDIYHPVKKRSFNCDILYVTNLGNPENTLAPFHYPNIQLNLNTLEEKLIESNIMSKKELEDFYKILFKKVNSLKINEIWKVLEFRNQFTLPILKKMNISVDTKTFESFLTGDNSRLYYELISRSKMVIIEYIIQNFPDLEVHVYGKNWDTYPKLKQVSKGEAENSKQLNELMNQAKICLHVAGTGLHMRSIEIIASESFMLYYQVEIKNNTPLSEYFTEGEEIIGFKDEKELLIKIPYYLNNESERNQIANKALKKAKKNFGYHEIAKKIINSTLELLKKNK